MFAPVMMPPIFGHSTIGAAAVSPYRPARPSPLSSSPLRAASPPAASRLLAQLDTRSSPTPPSSMSSVFLDPVATDLSASSSPSAPAPPKNLFRFAARPAKPVPRLQQSRDATRQTRRSLFLNNVRQRADDSAWKRRDCEQELQKLEWWSLEREIRQARETDALGMLSEQDIDDAADWMVQQERQQRQQLQQPQQPQLQQQPLSPFPGRHSGGAGVGAHRDDGEYNYYYDHAEEADEDAEMLLDDDEQHAAERRAAEDEAELEALLASMAAADAVAEAEAEAQAQAEAEARAAVVDTAAPQNELRPASPAFSDDDDNYDALFAELLAEQAHAGPRPEAAAGHEDTEMGS